LKNVLTMFRVVKTFACWSVLGGSWNSCVVFWESDCYRVFSSFGWLIIYIKTVF